MIPAAGTGAPRTAVAQALEHALPGRFAPVICDPLRGSDVPWLLRWFAGLYGPCIRLTPWLWWLFWRASESPRVLGAVRRTVMAPVYGQRRQGSRGLAAPHSSWRSTR